MLGLTEIYAGVFIIKTLFASGSFGIETLSWLSGGRCACALL